MPNQEQGPDCRSPVAGSPPTVYLHIGTPKSGTTYLQSRMSVNHQRAADQGLLWPGPGWGKQVRAVDELRHLKPEEQLDSDGPWMRMARQARSWSGPRVVISMEWMVGLRKHQIEAALASLQPCRVEVVCTARDLLRAFVAQWQEMTKNRRTWTWDEYVERVFADEHSRVRRSFWEQQGVPGIVERWSPFVPTERMHLVTVPHAGADPEVLWRRWCDLLQLDGTDFAPPKHANESLGVVSAVLMRRINVRAEAQGLTQDEYKRVVGRVLAGRVLAARRKEESAFAVSPEVDARIRERARAEVERLKRFGVDVVGDLDDLLPGPPLQGREPNQVTEEELLDTSIDAMLTMAVDQHRELQALRVQVRSAAPGARRPRLMSRSLRPLRPTARAGLAAVRRRLGAARGPS